MTATLSQSQEAPKRPGSSRPLGWWASLLLAQVAVEQRIFWRNRSGVFFTFVFPLLLLGFFATFTEPHVLLPGVAALVVVSTTFQALAIALAFHREQGVLKRLLATPLPPAVLISGKLASSALVALLEVGIVVALAIGVFGLALPQDPLLFLLALLAGTFAFSALGVAVASAIAHGESAPAVTNAIYLPLLFVSGVFYELEAMPRFLQLVAQAFPLAHLVSLLRDGWFGGTAGAAETLMPLAALLAWGAAGTAWSLRRFRWEPAHES